MTPFAYPICLPWLNQVELSNLVALLRWNLFTYRDLWRWIDAPFNTPAGSEVALQTWLMLDSIQPQRQTTSS